MAKIGPKIKTFLMFEGQAEEAMNFYVSLFEDSEITSIKKYGPNEAGPEGSVNQAVFKLAGQSFMCIDSYVNHAFSFTPAISLFVECESDEEIERTFAKLMDGGTVYMPLDAYPFSTKFGWVGDKFGVTWQLNLA